MDTTVITTGETAAELPAKPAPEVIIEAPTVEEIAADTARSVELIEAQADAEVAIITARAEGEALIETVRQGDDEWRSQIEARLQASETTQAEILGIVQGLAIASTPAPSPEPPAPAPAETISPDAVAGDLPAAEAAPLRKRYARVL